MRVGKRKYTYKGKIETSKNWYVFGHYRGKPFQQSTGTADKRKAEAYRIRLEAELEDSRIFGRKATATFTQAVEGYLNIGGEEKYILPLLDYFKGYLLKDITQDDIDRAAIRLYPNCKASTHNRQVYTPVAAVLNYASRAKLMDKMDIQRPRLPKPNERFLYPADAESFIQTWPEKQQYKPVTLLGTGMRAGEAMTLLWKDVDLRNGEAKLFDTKTATNRTIELPRRVIIALANVDHKEGHVFRRPRDGKPYNYTGENGGQMKSEFKGDIYPHLLRHTWATWFYAIHRDFPRLLSVGGWTTEKTALRYVKLAPRGLADQVEEYGWGFGSVQQGKEQRG